MFTVQAAISLVLGVMYAMYEGVPSTEWRLYTKSEYALYQYDTENVRHLSNNLVMVRQRVVLNDRGRTHLAQELGKEYENVKEIITLREIDCTRKKSHILGLTYFSGNGWVVKREFYEPIEWDAIVQDSVDAVLYQAVCE